MGSIANPSPGDLRRYKQQRIPELQTLVGSALKSLEGQDDLVDWFDYCTPLSEAAFCFH